MQDPMLMLPTFTPCYTSNGMISSALVTIEEVFAEYDASTGIHFYVQGYQFWRTSGRLQLFRQKGIQCVDCGLTANLFSIEKPKRNLRQRNHLNLYNLTESKFTMFTKDHIVPRSRGGEDELHNYDTMCQKCNTNKGDTLTPRALQMMFERS